jgi:septal ring factor EnvC (AmiA/AmiB activator)
LAQITATPETASPQPQGFFESGRGWVLAVAVWLLAAALVVAVFWVFPRAAASRRLDNDKASLQVSVSQARRDLENARERLAMLQTQLDALQTTRDRLNEQAERNDRRIAGLNKRIKGLESERKAAEAAVAAAAGTGDGTGVFSVPPPIHCTPYIDNSNGTPTPTMYCPSP